MKTLFTTIKTTVVLLSLSLLFSACSKLEKPDSDSTPPVLKWKIHFMEDNTETEVTENAKTIKVKKGNEVKVTLIAEDEDGGVQKITFGGSFTFHCVSRSVGQNSNGTLETDVQNLYPDENNNVLSSIFLIKEVSTAFTCQTDYTLTNGSYDLVGTAENYYNGVTTSTLKIETD